ncbi:MAG TPA: DUF1259 domain-containing protein [Elusimicrobiota bacterium]|nr:DUF1259 domain-containing protein [Elusimicrobiota bacterium]
MKKIILSAVLLAAGGTTAAGQDAKLDAARIEALTGLKGQLNEKEGVFKVSYPRDDIKATVAGVAMTPALGLTAWAAFTRMDGRAMVMGDIVLLEDQVNPVMSAALDNGLEVTALHNHFLWDSPRVMFMHVGGMGDEEKLARGVGAVFAKLKETIGAKGPRPDARIDPARSTLDPAKIDAVLGRKGELAKGVYKVTIGFKSKMGEREIGSAMGVNTWAAFAGSDEKAVVDGDFAMSEGQLQGVLKALRRAGISIVAIHTHMTGESPRVMFLHYWGVGKTTELAAGLKSALDTQME